MVDFKRTGPKEGEPLVEQVQRVRYDPCRTADIAIVAGGNHKRYILASQNMKTGDLIKTSGKLTRMAGMGRKLFCCCCCACCSFLSFMGFGLWLLGLCMHA